MVHRFVSFRLAPSFESEISEEGTVFGADGCKKCVQSSGIFEKESVATVQDGLGLGIDLVIQEENVRHQTS